MLGFTGSPAGAAFAIAALTSGAGAQTVPDPAPATPPTGRPSGQDEILVVAPPSERSSIDRTTYTIRDSAEARTSNVLDLLGRIPTVEVTPSGQLRLLGRSGVQILVDGREVSDPNVVLRNMRGTQIARIEVISNPSAQFSAQGTAGIINIVTRRLFASGLGGSATARGGSLGGYELRASPTWSQGPVSLSGAFGYSRTASSSEFGTDRRSLDTAGPVDTESSERGRRESRGRAWSGDLTATYQLTPAQSITLRAFGADSDFNSTRRSEIRSTFGQDRDLDQSATGRSGITAVDLSAEYRQTGSRQGEEFTLSGQVSTGDISSRNVFSTAGSVSPSLFEVRSRNSSSTATIKFDYTLPVSGRGRVAVGGEFEYTSVDNLTTQEGVLPLSQDPIAAFSPVKGLWSGKALYFTYQFPLLGAMVLAGLRMEDRHYSLVLPTRLTSHQVYAFPSLHIERPMGAGLTANLSYSRRVNWPNLADLSPVVRFSDATTANFGNPFVQPELTDSYELKLNARIGSQDIEATAYVRRTNQLRSALVELDDDGLLIIRPVNLGDRISRGLNVVIQGGLGGGFRYSLSGNLADQSIDSAGSASSLGRRTLYSTSARLEYQDGPEGRRNTDRVELRARYVGPNDFAFFRISPFVSANASWSHAFTDRLSSVLSVSDLFGSPRIRTRYLSDIATSRQFEQARGPSVTVSLTYSLDRTTTN